MRLKPLLFVVPLMVLAWKASPVAAQPLSHQGQKIHEHIVLVGPAGTDSTLSVCDWTRLRSNGRLESQSFSIPDGRVLVITDVEWSAALERETQSTSFTNAMVELTIHLGASFPPEGLPVFQSRSVHVPEQVLQVGSNEQTTTGFVVAPDTRMCAWATLFVAGSASFSDRQELAEVILRGYLIDGPPRRAENRRPEAP